MHFVLYCLDKKNAAQVRLDNRPAHVEFLHSWGDAISLAGPLLSEDGGGMIGSMIVLDVESRADADRFVCDQQAAGLAHAGVHRCLVPGPQAAQIDDFCINAVGGDRFGGLVRFVQGR